MVPRDTLPGTYTHFYTFLSLASVKGSRRRRWFGLIQVEVIAQGQCTVLQQALSCRGTENQRKKIAELVVQPTGRS